MSRILIIPDVHNRTEFVESIIKRVEHDEVIFLGDIFDDFGDDPYIISEVAKWFKWSVHQKNRTHLCGNHDVHYWFADNRNTRCSGYEQFKSMAINDIVSKVDWEKLKFFTILGDKWLLSHGGVHPFWINTKEVDGAVSLKESLETDSILAKKKLYAKDGHWFTAAGHARCSSARYAGGLLWCDWNKEFVPIKGLHQIVGHTPQHNPYWMILNSNNSFEKLFVSANISDPNVKNIVLDTDLKNDNSYNICIDSGPGSQYYAIYEDGKLTIHHVDNIGKS